VGVDIDSDDERKGRGRRVRLWCVPSRHAMLAAPCAWRRASACSVPRPRLRAPHNAACLLRCPARPLSTHTHTHARHSRDPHTSPRHATPRHTHHSWASKVGLAWLNRWATELAGKEDAPIVCHQICGVLLAAEQTGDMFGRVAGAGGALLHRLCAHEPGPARGPGDARVRVRAMCRAARAACWRGGVAAVLVWPAAMARQACVGWLQPCASSGRRLHASKSAPRGPLALATPASCSPGLLAVAFHQGPGVWSSPPPPHTHKPHHTTPHTPRTPRNTHPHHTTHARAPRATRRGA
jgi:hypothetical protein